MNKKELRKLKRTDLFEIMLAQSEEIDRLRAELATLKKQLEDKRILLEKRGTLAEASLALTNIFEEAQKAADLYRKRPITRYLSNHSFLQYTVIKNKLEDFLCHNPSSH